MTKETRKMIRNILVGEEITLTEAEDIQEWEDYLFLAYEDDIATLNESLISIELFYCRNIKFTLVCDRRANLGIISVDYTERNCVTNYIHIERRFY